MVELHKLQQKLYDEFDPKLVSLTDTLRVAKDLIHKLLSLFENTIFMHKLGQETDNNAVKITQKQLVLLLWR